MGRRGRARERIRKGEKGKFRKVTDEILVVRRERGRPRNGEVNSGWARGWPCKARMHHREGGGHARGDFRVRMSWAVGKGDQGHWRIERPVFASRGERVAR